MGEKKKDTWNLLEWFPAWLTLTDTTDESDAGVMCDQKEKSGFRIS